MKSQLILNPLGVNGYWLFVNSRDAEIFETILIVRGLRNEII